MNASKILGTTQISNQAMDGPLKPNYRLDTGVTIESELSGVVQFAATEKGDAYYCSERSLIGLESASAFALFPRRLECLSFHSENKIVFGLSSPNTLCFASLPERAGGYVTIDTELPLPNGYRLQSLSVDSDKAYGALVRDDLRFDSWEQIYFREDQDGLVISSSIDKPEIETLSKSRPFIGGLTTTKDEQRKSLLSCDTTEYRISRFDLESRSWVIAIDDLPGYPLSIRPNKSGYWLAIGTLRNSFCDFVRSNRRFWNLMCDELPIGDRFYPRISTDGNRPYIHYQEMDHKKEVIRTATYGLVIHLDKQFRIDNSLHSVRFGDHHGIYDILPMRNGELATVSLQHRNMKKIHGIHT